MLDRSATMALVITHNFSFLGKLSQTEYPDVFLTTPDGGGKVLPAHRVVLAAVSDKLFTLCEKGGRVVVRNIRYVVLERIVRLIYMGFVKIRSNEEVDDVMDGIDMMKMNMNITKSSNQSETEVSQSDEYYKSADEENIKQKGEAENILFEEANNYEHKILPQGDPIIMELPRLNSLSENILHVSFKKSSQYVINDRIKNVKIPTKSARRKARRPSKSPWILKSPSPCSSLSVDCSSDSSDADDILTDVNVPLIVENPFFVQEKPVEETMKYPDNNNEATTSVQRKPEPPNLVQMPEQITSSQLERVCKVGARKVYCKRSGAPGTTCHQCRNKTTDTKTVCRSGKCVGIRGQFCGPCLQLKYGEDAREALVMPDWKCPPCRNICSCSMCRSRKKT